MNRNFNQMRHHNFEAFNLNVTKDFKEKNKSILEDLEKVFREMVGFSAHFEKIEATKSLKQICRNIKIKRLKPARSY